MNFLLQTLDRWADDCPYTVAFAQGDETISYHRLRERVGGQARAMAGLPDRLGLLAPNGFDWIIADLACWATGRTLAPLPGFFADSQLRHILEDADIDWVLCTAQSAARVRALGARPVVIGDALAELPEAAAEGAARIIYTSGSTGRPKGVVLNSAQLAHTCTGLLAAVKPSNKDRHLSVLPFAMLLETICGIYVPLLVGGRVHIADALLTLPPVEVAAALAKAALAGEATTTVLVPQLLAAWVMIAGNGRIAVPASLRFVAVGGAPVPEAVTFRARLLGIPAYEGYGLSECGSVVAINTPDDDRPGSVGRPIAGLDVTIADDGEIMVAGGSVMAGYIHDGADRLAETPAPWPTGDIGHLDDDGYLYVQGRKDSLIVTAQGRNVSPEWLEAMFAADARIGRAVALPTDDGGLSVTLEPSLLGRAWFDGADADALNQLTADLCAEAPPYAQPCRTRAVAMNYFTDNHLLTANGRLRREAIRRHFATAVGGSVHEDIPHAVL